MANPLLDPAGGATHLLLGNEAIVRGALEAGVNIVSCYPGTPSSEVPDTFYKIRSGGRFQMEYSINEKVALEVAAGAALGGALSLVTMKHVGVNVAADPLFTAAYIGLPGGMVLLSADDPGCHSSQNEQDNRIYARFAGLPCFEPASAQEAKDMTRDALLFARATQQPVLLRTTTRVSHLRGPVVFGPLPDKNAEIVPFERDMQRFLPIPSVALKRHPALAANLENIRAQVEKSPWNREYGKGKLGVVASGISRAYLHDALDEYGLHGDATVLELGFSWPLPNGRLEAFMRRFEHVLVLEELEPLLEEEMRALAQRLGLSVKISGKSDILTRFGEYSTTKVGQALLEALGRKTEEAAGCTGASLAAPLPVRPPNLCAGCAHRAVYYAVRKVFGDEAYYSSDIGCYTLGSMPPLKTADFLLCMGSSISAGSGFARASGKPVVAFIGDSTFFHSGMTGLANAVFNKHDVLLVILDNGTTAMTGHQPNPGMDQEVLGADALHLDIEAVVRGLGVAEVAKVRPYQVKGVSKILEEFKAKSGVRVIIAEEPCVLYARRTLKKARPQTAYVETQAADAFACAETLGCPAFTQHEGKLDVDPSACAGCMVCMQVSTSFKARKKEQA